MFLDMEAFTEGFLRKRKAHSGVVVGARSVVEERVVDTLNVAVHVGRHGKRRSASTLLILILLVHIPYLSAGTLRFNPVDVDVGTHAALLVKVLGLVFLGGLDEFHEGTTVFSGNGDDSHAGVLGVRNLSVKAFLLGLIVVVFNVAAIVRGGLGPVDGFLD